MLSGIAQVVKPSQVLCEVSEASTDVVCVVVPWNARQKILKRLHREVLFTWNRYQQKRVSITYLCIYCLDVVFNNNQGPLFYTDFMALFGLCVPMCLSATIHPFNRTVYTYRSGAYIHSKGIDHLITWRTLYILKKKICLWKLGRNIMFLK